MDPKLECLGGCRVIGVRLQGLRAVGSGLQRIGVRNEANQRAKLHVGGVKLQGLAHIVQALEKSVASCAGGEAGIPHGWMGEVEEVFRPVEDDGNPLCHHCPRDGVSHPRHVTTAVQSKTLHVVVVDEVPQQVQVIQGSRILLQQDPEVASMRSLGPGKAVLSMTSRPAV